MVKPQSLAVVQNWFVRLTASLLQYSEESTPWVSHGDKDRREELASLAQWQQDSIRTLAACLPGPAIPRGSGVYPDYSDLHDVGLDFLLRRISDHQALLVQDLESLLKDCPSDERPMFESILAREKSILGRLKSLRREKTSTKTSS